MSETGLMTFTATAGSTASQVAWIGKINLNVTGNGLSLTVGVSVPISDGSGDGPAGGKVFYDKGDYEGGWRYLEAAPSDQSAGIVWSNIKTTLIGATARGTAIGTGQTNTTAIVNQSGCTSGAAKTCDALIFGGYDDWFLPSKDELNEMNGKNPGGPFVPDYYFSSSEYNDLNAWCCNFGDGRQDYGLKETKYPVRAVRAF